MFPTSKAFALTLVFTIALLFATLAEANNDAPLRRDHGALKRLIKKRSPQILANPALAPTPDRAATIATAAPPTSAPADPATPPADPPPRPSAPVVTSAPPAPPSAAPPPPVTTTPLVPAVVNSILSPVIATPTVSQPAAVISVAPTVSAVVPTTTAVATPVLPPSPTTAAGPKVTTSGGKPGSPNIVTLTSEVAAAAATKTGVPARNAAMQKTVTTVLIVIASVVGGTALIWTIIRKWKFSPSNSFEDRMQPIDWQPTNEESGLPPSRRLSNASSFHSAGHSDNMAGYGMGGGYGATSDYGHNHGGYGSSDHGHGSSDLGRNVAPLQPVPDHDFTAAPSNNLAPIGVYADLARGPSPGPPMQEAYRGPVVYQGYDGSHDAYDYNGGTRY